MSNLLNITCSSVSKLVSNAHNLDNSLIEMIQFKLNSTFTYTQKTIIEPLLLLGKGYAHKCDMHGENINIKSIVGHN